MQKKVLLIHKGKSFMLNTIVKNLVDDGYEVVEAAPEMEEIAAGGYNGHDGNALCAKIRAGEAAN